MITASFKLSRGLSFSAVLVAALMWFGFGLAQAEPTFPELTGRVVDNADLLNSSQEQALTEKLRETEEKTSAQIVVATLPSLQGYDIRDYGYRLGRHWGIGQKEKDNGVLLLIAPVERKVAIEVGYGLEAILTDALSKLIIEHKIIPYFRQGDFASGIQAGVNDIATLVSQDENAEELKQDYTASDEDISPIVIFILIVVLIIIINNMSGGGGRRRSGTWGGPVGGGWSGGSSSSGGGGWSGGGGSFGGGGASGGW